MNNDGLIVDAGENQASATAITLAYIQPGSVGFDLDENDYYAFTASQSGELSVSLTNLSDNLDLRLYRASGSHILSSSQLQTVDESIIYQVVAGQSYFIRVDPNGDSESNYELEAKISSGGKPDGGVTDASDFLTSARLISLPYADDGSVGFGSDADDYYRFTSPIAGEISVELSALTGDSDLYVLHSGGEILATSLNSGFDDESISFDAGLGLTYYIHIDPKSGEESDYQLTVTPADAGTSDGSGSDVSNFFASAVQIALPYNANGSVGFGADTDDYYKIETNSSGVLTVQLNGLEDNIDVRLYNDTNSQIASSQQASTNTEVIQFDVGPVDTYVIRVDPFSDAESKYTLTASLELTTKSYVEQIALLYEAALDRQPDNDGLNYFVGNFNDGQSLQEIANSFYISDEFRNDFTDFTNNSYINQLYLNVLDREADDEGLEYWQGQLANGLTQADILFSFAESDENYDNAANWLVNLEYDAAIELWLL